MEKIIINEKEKGLLFKNGKLIKLLHAGKYNIYGNREIEKFHISGTIFSEKVTSEALLKSKDISGAVCSVDVGDEQLAFHFINGRFARVLSFGTHLFWKDAGEHEYILADISTPYVAKDFPVYLFSKIDKSFYHRIDIPQSYKGLVYFDNRLEKVLDAGTYYFWNNSIKIDVNYVDTRLIHAELTGQEILTLDKVSLRINLVCNYRITDYVKIYTEIDNYTEQIHVLCQLALREYIGKHKLDEILENKEEMAAFVLEKLKEKEKDLFIEISDAGIKDIILPGEIRSIMNTVLIAEKKAQANVITRREEVASTRSLLNTAKLMDENETLYKLKELEFIERICENVGNIELSGKGDILSQLTQMFRKE